MKTIPFSDFDRSPVGTVYNAVCLFNKGYENTLTVGKQYQITITPRIMPLTALCGFINDKGKKGEAHLYRFAQLIEE